MPRTVQLFLAVLGGFGVCAIGTTVGVVLSNQPGVLGFNHVTSTITTRPAFLVALPLAMLVGIWTNALWTQIAGAEDKAKDEVDIGLAFRQAAKSRHLWQSILVSPIVYASVYSLTKHEPDAVVAILLAFQNGFFWNAVLEGKRKRIAV